MRSILLVSLALFPLVTASADDDWISLFDGTSLKGWRVAAKPEDEKKGFWSVKDGAITCDSRGRKDHNYVWLLNNRDLYDFDLKMKVRSFRESPGNSGVQIRSRWDLDNLWMDGPQIDIHPPAPFRTGLIYDETRGVRHWIFPVLPGSKIEPAQGPKEFAWKHSDEGDGWNDLLIECRGTTIKTTVNGIRIADYDGRGVLDDDTHKIRNTGIHGNIALQLHTGDDLYIQFKDIYLKNAPGPLPLVIQPAGPNKAPSDAIVLFDGKDLSEWTTNDSGKLTGWTVQDGVILTTSRREEGEKRAFDLLSKRKFGSAQIHVEYNVPYMPDATGQARGNSGVKIQTRYEIQILDSIDNPTYPHGTNASLYNFFPPLVNASELPDHWQTFDIVFHQPKCAGGKLTVPGRLTLLHNGVLVQDNVPVIPRRGCPEGPEKLLLQDHFHPNVKQTPMKFRNIWVRPLE